MSASAQGGRDPRPNGAGSRERRPSDRPRRGRLERLAAGAGRRHRRRICRRLEPRRAGGRRRLARHAGGGRLADRWDRHGSGAGGAPVQRYRVRHRMRDADRGSLAGNRNGRGRNSRCSAHFTRSRQGNFGPRSDRAAGHWAQRRFLRPGPARTWQRNRRRGGDLRDRRRGPCRQRSVGKRPLGCTAASGRATANRQGRSRAQPLFGMTRQRGCSRDRRGCLQRRFPG